MSMIGMLLVIKTVVQITLHLIIEIIMKEKKHFVYLWDTLVRGVKSYVQFD